MKASKADIKFYKGVLLIAIHDKMVSDGTTISIDELDTFLKSMIDYEGSTKDITHEQMQDLKEVCKFLADQINCKIDNID